MVFMVWFLVTKRDYSIRCIARTRRVRYLENARFVGGHGLVSVRLTFGPSRPLEIRIPTRTFKAGYGVRPFL
jgi:hypothetical protein